MNSNKINQKEYLKRYLVDDVRKKKKKGKLSQKPTINIVDDDIELSQISHAAECELDNYTFGEDLPQIAGIIDERPADLIAKEDYKTNGKWKTVESDEMVNSSKNPDISIKKNYSRRLKNINSSPDESPPRNSKRIFSEAQAMSSLSASPGLSNSKALRVENEQFRKREDDMFGQMQKTDKRKDNNVIYGRKTGRHRRLHEDDWKDREKLQKEEERKKIYDRWGIGLKQIEDYKKQFVSESHEMNKPIARYANDEDLEEYLRSQCRQGDPMATYFRKKANDSQSGPRKPIYHGSFPENRFNIRPGYRWDGVDRSNGYEKKWFEVLNQKKAIDQDAYKFSVEDM